MENPFREAAAPPRPPSCDGCGATTVEQKDFTFDDQGRQLCLRCMSKLRAAQLDVTVRSGRSRAFWGSVIGTVTVLFFYAVLAGLTSFRRC